MNSPEVMTIKQAAEFLQLHYQTVYEKILNKEIPASKVGRVWRVQKKDVIAYLERQKKG
ncbi:MAG: DNA-binding protein [Actinobacteria bacterium]|nr:MAG: DNA-binding protein [Actinomycetota bacterium]